MFKLTKLKNGINFITVPVKGTMATTVLAMFPVGSRYENKKMSGAAHFLEHMLFKGTQKRPTAQDISRALEAHGAEFNAFTNKDYTGYYIKIDGSHQEVAFDMLSDMLYHSKLETVEVEKEKGAIVEELRMYKDNPLMAVDELFDSVMFGNTPMGWEIGGTPETVRAITREELFNFYQTHYSPKNMTLVVAGNISGKVKKLLNYFTDKTAPAIAKGPAFYQSEFEKIVWPKQPPSLEDRVAVEQRKADQAQVIMGFPTNLGYNSPERYIHTLLITILGVGMSSRLFVEVRERRGLAYMVHAGAASFRDAGVSYVQAGLDPARIKDAFKVIKTELALLTTQPVSATELKDAKTSIAGGIALAMENSRAQADWYGKEQIFRGKILTPDQAIKKLNTVTAKQIQDLAKKIFVPEQMRMAVIGPLDKAQIINLIK